MSQATTTTDHDEIRRWAEERGGRPSLVRTGRGKGGILRFDFGEDDEKLEETSWDEFFEVFDDNKLAFLHQDQIGSGQTSRFFKFVARGKAGAKGGARRGASAKGGAGKRRAAGGAKRNAAKSASKSGAKRAVAGSAKRSAAKGGSKGAAKRSSASGSKDTAKRGAKSVSKSGAKSGSKPRASTKRAGAKKASRKR
jgi:hypothetical protein